MSTVTMAGFPEDDNLRSQVQYKVNVYIGYPNNSKSRAQVASEVENLLKTKFNKMKNNF